MSKTHSYIKIDPWKISEEGFDPKRVKSSESIFSLGNGAMGQRANFEERYSGPTFQGSYVGGVYYPDKTKVGWWKNGYPEYFAKVLNAPNWIGMDLFVDGNPLDLFKSKKVKHFRRELDMQTGIYLRSFEVEMQSGKVLDIQIKRFLSLTEASLGVIQFNVKVLQGNCSLSMESFVDGDVRNQDSNWDDPFWNHIETEATDKLIGIHSKTNKSNFEIFTYAYTYFEDSKGKAVKDNTLITSKNRLAHLLDCQLKTGESCSFVKLGGYINGKHHPSITFKAKAKQLINNYSDKSFDTLAHQQALEWSKIWEDADIQIEGDVAAQQAIRYNIYQLNQTYNGKDAELNIGPKGFTGEKYGGSTYWDTEAYCLPFYMATKGPEIARNLLKYRYNQLEKAIENAEKLGFKRGAALYPMVTLNGEECHNEWEITFEEIHRNGAIAYAIYNYERFTGDTQYIPEMGIEVLVGIARFWAQRVNFSNAKKAYVILGVTGPNEYENNVNNNWYTNYIAKWCLEYTLSHCLKIQHENPTVWKALTVKLNFVIDELNEWKEIAKAMYLPKHPEQELFLQQDGFLDKTLDNVNQIPVKQRPINQHWSWDRILRSPYIKQADVLQGFYFFGDHFNHQALETHFDFYEPLTVHESSLSPCIHAILAARLNRMNQAYSFYLQTSRLDLDDYNKEVEEGLHITSMAGTWLSVIEGFGGVQIIDNKLYLNPKLPNHWSALKFKLFFRGTWIQVKVSKSGVEINKNNPDVKVICQGKTY